MALNSEELEQAIIVKIQEAARILKPNEVQGVEVQQTPQEDGSTEYNLNEQRGPLEIGEDDIRHLARGIAEAVVAHIAANATITGSGVGTDWRIE